jgi:threonine dehydrogenase-like Zn-dependent dehydrogenase
MVEKLMGHSPAALFGYSHLFGGYAGGQAEYVRVPFADVGPLKVPDGLADEQVLFLTDIFRLDTWQQRTAIFSRMIRWLFGDADPSDSSRLKALSYWVPSA